MGMARPVAPLAGGHFAAVVVGAPIQLGSEALGATWHKTIEEASNWGRQRALVGCTVVVCEARSVITTSAVESFVMK